MTRCYRCYGCLTATVGHCITLLHALTTQPFSTRGARLIQELVSHNLNSGPMTLRRDAMLLLCALTKDKPEATALLYNSLYQRITDAMEFCTSAASLVTNSLIAALYTLPSARQLQEISYKELSITLSQRVAGLGGVCSKLVPSAAIWIPSAVVVCFLCIAKAGTP